MLYAGGGGPPPKIRIFLQNFGNETAWKVLSGLVYQNLDSVRPAIKKIDFVLRCRRRNCLRPKSVAPKSFFSFFGSRRQNFKKKNFPKWRHHLCANFPSFFFLRVKIDRARSRKRRNCLGPRLFEAEIGGSKIVFFIFWLPEAKFQKFFFPQMTAPPMRKFP